MWDLLVFESHCNTVKAFTIVCWWERVLRWFEAKLISGLAACRPILFGGIMFWTV